MEQTFENTSFHIQGYTVHGIQLNRLTAEGYISFRRTSKRKAVSV